ncbi:stage V sporulation protein D [Clostridium magnum]|uniref:Stage V sporulation protein D n=1 Tax=Clostridium magnum DSM 2767 TaxID=1121326 RepID=A0A162T4I3_9CLOT|nr:stage V sporulation protein D [Clostridium magnum]KZL92234.1 stage V sporulation protein D [Clostridium magnum DSM 2767]SHH16871.1 stage V sporulation protein D (sporulation-specific penicillin-binding protein) [Clostridium magnum DSM 2767]
MTKKEVISLVQKKNTNKTKFSKRLIVALFMLTFIFLFMLGRLSYIMIVKSPKYKSEALKQWTSNLKIPAKRGQILDRNGLELAVSMNSYRLDLDMTTLRQTLMDKKMTNEQLSEKLSSVINMPADEISKILNRTSSDGNPIRFAILTRGIDKSQADKVKALDFRGIIISSDSKRYYPNNAFLSSVLGFVNAEGKGVSGVELTYDKELSGTPGSTIFQTDNKSSQLPFADSEYSAPVDGKDLILTIDENIQLVAERAATRALNSSGAKSVSITVMDPKTGDILAMVSKPDFDPNNPYKKDSKRTTKSIEDLLRVDAVQNSFEPGSIFKVITAYAAIKEGVANENSTFVCNGSLNVDGHTIYCWERNGHGTESFADIIKNSCNVGFMQLGKSLGKEKLTSYTKQFGFGQKTGIDLPGESSGIIKNADKMNNVDLASLAFGQGLSVTAVQYLSAFNAIANGGTWIRPHIMKEIRHTDENNKTTIDKQFSEFDKKQIVDSVTAATLRGYLEQVVSKGVGNNAFIEGYHIAGKTGTAEKANLKGGGYETDKYFSSFAGMAPANDPKVTLLVSIDEPDPTINYYAGQVSAPVAKELFNDIFSYMIMKGQLSLN